MNETSIFESANFFMVRHAHTPLEILDKISEENDPTLFAHKYYMENPLFQEGIAIASPDLHRSLQKSILKNGKASISLLKYLVRTYSRATPFGLFSSVQWGSFESQTEFEINQNVVKRKIRPSSELVALITEKLLSEKKIAQHFKVRTNPLISFRQGRAFLPKTLGLNSQVELDSIQITSASSLIFSLAQLPIEFHLLEQEIIKAFPNSNPIKIKEYLWQIFKKEFLLSELSQDINSIEYIKNLSDLIELLDPAKSSEIEFFLNEILEYEKSPVKEAIKLYEKIIEKEEFGKIKHPLQIDTYYDFNEASINSKLQKTLEDAATVLWKISRSKALNGKTEKIHQHFLQSYGTERLIPLLEVASDPQVITFMTREESPHEISKLEAFIFSFGQPQEISIDEFIKNLPEPTPAEVAAAPTSLELLFEITPSTPLAIESNQFQIVLHGLTPQFGSTFGRFLHLFDSNQMKRLAELRSQEEKLLPDLTFIEASFIPRNLKAANIRPLDHLSEYQLHTHFHEDSPTTLNINDLFIGATTERVYIFSKKLNREVHVILGSALNPKLAPLPLQILLEISKSRFSNFQPILGPVSRSVRYLPKIKYKNVILSPAVWHFDFISLGLDVSHTEEFVKKTLKDALIAMKVPKKVYITDRDHRLLVNWENPYFLELIFQHFMDSRDIVLTECLIQTSEIQSTYITEFVVPFVKKSSFGATKSNPSFPSVTQIDFKERIFLPGSEWLHTKIFLEADEAERFIQYQLFPFINFIKEKYEIEKWFYIRYIEKKHHIRLRFRTSPLCIISHILPEINQWAANLWAKQIINDFQICSYERELERYGGPDCINFAEDFFFCDSTYCCKILSQSMTQPNPLPIFITASFGLIHILSYFFTKPSQYLDFLQPKEEQMEHLSGLRPFRRLATDFINYILSNENVGTSKIDERLKLILSNFPEVSNSLTSLSNKIIDLEKKKGLWTRSSHLIDSLIHMHCNRLMGPNPQLEIKARLAAFYFFSKTLDRFVSKQSNSNTILDFQTTAYKDNR